MTEEAAHQLLGLYPRRRAPAARRIVLPISMPPYRISPRLSLQLHRAPAPTPYFSLPYPPEICQFVPPKTKRLIMSQKSITRVGPASTAQSSRTAARHSTPRPAVTSPSPCAYGYPFRRGCRPVSSSVHRAMKSVGEERRANYHTFARKFGSLPSSVFQVPVSLRWYVSNQMCSFSYV